MISRFRVKLIGRICFGVTVTAALLLLCGCTSNRKERFYRDMRQHYEVQCDKYYSIYTSGDIEDAKQAMRNIIALSLEEQGKTKYYWRFDLMIAFAKARLAVIAEDEGHEQEAQSLFADASHYMALQKTNLREHLSDFPNVEFGEYATNSAEVPTPDQWRKTIAKLDPEHVRWKSANVSRPTPVAH